MPVGLFNRAVVAAMPFVPRPLVWRFSRRYIAGVGLDDAYRTVSELNAADCSATIDVLGEDSTDEEQVRSAVDLYLQAIRDIHAKSLRCGVSIKLSELGLRFDVGKCSEAARTLIASAADHGSFVRIQQRHLRRNAGLTAPSYHVWANICARDMHSSVSKLNILNQLVPIPILCARRVDHGA